jgi:hypothetical protein
MTQMLLMTAAVVTGGDGGGLVGFRESLIVTPTSPGVGGQFGTAVDVHAAMAIVGATDQDPDVWGVAGPGFASVLYLDESDGSLLDQVDLQASDGEEGDVFGYRVAIGTIAADPDESGVAYVSAIRRGGEGGISNAGGVYVFREGVEGIAEAGLILPSETPTARLFGGSLDFDGTTLVVGGPFDSTEVDGPTPILNHGSVWVFEIGADGMPTSEHRLTSDVPALGQYFGWSVCVDGDRLAVGAIQDGASGVQSGAVYVFNRQLDASWVLDEVLTLSELGDSEWFGTSVSLQGDTLIASSIYATDPAGADGEPVPYAGVAVVFEHTAGAFNETQRIYPPAIDTVNPGWGVDLDFNGTLLAIGANQWNDGDLIQTGAVGIFERDAGGQFSRVRTELTRTPTQGGSFGVSVAVSDSNQVISGMPDVLESHGGMVSILSPTCSGDDDGDGTVGVHDLLALLELWGDTRIQAVDIEQDFEVNYVDLLLLIDQFATCELTPPV